LNRILFIAALLATAPAFAQWPDKPKTETKTDTAMPPPPPPPRRAARTSSEDDGSGFGLGIRAAWAFPTGDISGDQGRLSNSIDGQLPLWIEAGYHVNGNIYAGAYFQYAFSFDNCLTGTTCSSHGMKFGIEGLYNFLPSSFIQPWAGLGFGYEILSRSRSGDDTTLKGLELLNLQVGVDLALSKQLTVGPFASYQLFGKYSSFTASGISNDLSNTSGHSWLQTGIKASFRL
jgi:hypothetical protein